MTSITDHRPMITDPDWTCRPDHSGLRISRRGRKAFARLRDEHRVSYHRPYESTLLPPEEDTPGFWSVTKHQDCRFVSRNPKLLCSGKGVLMEDMPEVVITATASFW